MRSTRTTSVERNPKRDDNQSSISSLVPSVSAFFADSPSSVDPSFSSSSSHYSASTPTDTTGSGKKTRDMGKECLAVLRMEASMRVSGLMERNMDWERWYCRTAISCRQSGKTV
eukprot:GHVQ01007873.1.p1 GENE.GHVQ01007873.1~~GHVQ01007873.1.p1  ORF type:complete len:114 (-),score=26.57 GHVQ01007873.1:181-522(-)